MSEIPENEAPAAEIAEVETTPKKKRNWFYLLLKITFGFSAVLLIVLTVFSKSRIMSGKNFMAFNCPTLALYEVFSVMNCSIDCLNVSPF